MMMRVQARSRETFFMIASSSDGVCWDAEPHAIRLDGIPEFPIPYHLYDPRLTVLGDKCYVMFAADMDGFCTLGLAVTEDFESFTFLGYTEGTYTDTRNGVIFPEKVNGKFARLERPNIPQQAGNPTSGDIITYSTSEDLLTWDHQGNIISGRWHFWDERIGAGPPPIKTKHGWLVIYHGVATHFSSSNIYQAGAVILDLENPLKVLARTRHNILEPRELYETTGQVANVVFPSGAIVDTDDDGFAADEAQVQVYYGAADTSIGLATATVKELINACFTPGGHPGDSVFPQ